MAGFEWYSTLSARSEMDANGLEKWLARLAREGCAGVFAVPARKEGGFSGGDRRFAETMIELCHAAGMKCLVLAEAHPAELRALEALRPDAIVLDAAASMIRNGKLDVPLGLWVRTDGFPADAARASFVIGSGGSADVPFYADDAGLLSGELGAGYVGALANVAPEFFRMLKNALETGDRVRAEGALDFLRVAAGCRFAPEDVEYLYIKEGILSAPALRERRELDAFLRLKRYVYYSLLRHEPPELLTGYDVSFPECHASTVLPLENGRVLCVYFAGSREGADDVGIWLSVRENGAWRRPRRIAKVNDTAHWNPVIFAADDGIRVVFRVGRTIPGWVSYTMVSADGGETWSEPVPLGADNPAGGPVRNKPIRLADGRMLAPNSDESAEAWLPRVDESTDGGRTFHRLAPIPLNRTDETAPDFMPGAGAIQPTLWESAPGRVHALLRTQAGRVYRSDSEDGGRAWSTAYPTALPNNNSGIDLADTGRALYLVLNPTTGAWGPRTPLVVMKSTDNGETFEDFATLADDPIDDRHGREGQFCYPAIVARNGRLHITYTHNRKSIAYAEIEEEPSSGGGQV